MTHRRPTFGGSCLHVELSIELVRLTRENERGESVEGYPQGGWPIVVMIIRTNDIVLIRCTRVMNDISL